MIPHEAKNKVAQRNEYADWDDFLSKEGIFPDFHALKASFLEEAMNLLNECHKVDLYNKTKDLAISESVFKESKKKFSEGYRALISTHIAQITAVKMMNTMISSNHTHRSKNTFAYQFNTVLDSMISSLKDEARSGLWKFGSDFSSDDLPF